MTDKSTILAAIQSVLAQYDAPILLVDAIIEVESAWNPLALGDNGTSFGLFQLHIGGQLPAQYNSNPQAVFDPLLNAQIAMPAIARAWNALKGSFDANNTQWWLSFAASSGHPGGGPSDPATINEAAALQSVYKSLQAQGGTQPIMVQLSSTGEIADFLDVDQFQPAKTQFACGYFSGAIIKAMARVGQPPTQSVQAVIDEAETWYAQDQGNNSISNTNGMSLQEEYDLIVNKMGLHYQAVALDADTVRGWVRAGYPIMLTISETSVFDIALGGNPYTGWRPSGTHIFVVTGVSSDGNLLVRDPANCTNLYSANSLRPGPRKYDAGKLQIWTATVVVPPWLPRPTSAIPPTGGTMSNIPNGWTDDGQTLKDPNGKPLTGAIRTTILASNWQPGDVVKGSLHLDQPGQSVLLEDGRWGNGDLILFQSSSIAVAWHPDPALTGGVQQTNVTFVVPTGNELLWARRELNTANQQIAALKAQPPTGAVDTTALMAALNGITDGVAPLIAKAVVEAKKL